MYFERAAFLTSGGNGSGEFSALFVQNAQLLILFDGLRRLCLAAADLCHGADAADGAGAGMGVGVGVGLGVGATAAGQDWLRERRSISRSGGLSTSGNTRRRLVAIL